MQDDDRSRVPFGVPVGGGAYSPSAPAKGGGNHGCLIAAAVLLGVMALCACSGLGLLAYGYYSSPELQRVVGAAGEMVELAQKAQSDPGAVAMRAAGCEQAHVFATEDFLALSRAFEPDAPREALTPEDPRVVLSCVTRDRTLDCGALVRAYAGAHAQPASKVALSVETYPAGLPVCAGLFSSTGEKLGDLSQDYELPTGAAPSVPPAAPADPAGAAPAEPAPSPATP